jgi:hypothetical protein
MSGGEVQMSSVKERMGRPAVVRSEQPGRNQGGSECRSEANGSAYNGREGSLNEKGRR